MKRRVAKVLVCLCAALLLAAGIAPCCHASEVTDISSNPHVLFLSSYSYEWESIPKQLDGITDTLNGYARVDYMFMDTKRTGYDEVKDDIYIHIVSHGKGDPYDYVIAGDDAALKFVLEYREELFAGIPVVFEGINDESFAYEAARDPLITGIVETFPLEETVSMALGLNPGAARVVGISDDTVSGQGSSKQFMDCSKSFPGLEFSVIDCSELSCTEIGEAAADCGGDTVLIFLMMTTDADGNYYTNTEAVEYISGCAEIPVYKADELGIGYGVLGGVVVSYHAMSADAAAIVLALARGGDISDYPVQTAECYCSFDKAVMDELKITKADVSAGYDGDVKYINDELSFFQKHISVIVPAGVAVLVLAAFSVLAMLSAGSEKRLMQQLQDKDMMLNSLLDNIPGGLAVYRLGGADPDSIRTIYSSSGIPRLSGRTMEEYEEWIKGDLFENTVYEEDLPRLSKLVRESVAQKKPFYAQYRLKCRDGSLAPVSISAVWGHDERDGSCIYYAVYMDMTQQAKAQRAEREAVEARAANEAKGKFLSSMSHDIRTPLNAVLGFAALAQEEPGVPESVADYLTKIEASGRYLLGLVNDILDMAKIESGKIELQENSINWRENLESIACIFRAQAEEKGIRLITEFSVDETPWIAIDELRTRQICANLLSNAIKFSEKGTEIRWSVRGSMGPGGLVHAVCSISDQGCGMSGNFMSRVFQPFEQDAGADSRVGTGLGLSIVKNLVTLMGGSIRAESEPGKGSTFTLELDLKPGEPRDTKAPHERDAFTVLNGCRILLCEDNHINVVVAQRLLEKTGCAVDTAEDGKLALERFTASRCWEYDAILMDIRMPVMDGLEAAGAIRALQRPDAKKIPIIAMSANAFTEDVQASLGAGMNAHLSKPVDPPKLYSTLAEQLDGREGWGGET